MHVKAFFLVCLINELLLIYIIYQIYLWFSVTGLFYLASELIIFPLFLLCSFILISTLGSLFYTYKSLIYLYLLGIISILSAFSSLFYGSRLTLQPLSLFQSFSIKWGRKINQPETEFIQKKFQCCGFNHVKEFSNDLCLSSVSTPCLKKLTQNYTVSIQMGGLIFFLHGIAFCLCLFFIFINEKKNKK